jgi:hypothetical protein
MSLLCDKLTSLDFCPRYRIMLAFYGLRLVNETTGELALEDTVSAPSPASYLRRFHNLESNPHNFLRITRILKCLGEVSARPCESSCSFPQGGQGC